MTIDDLQSVTLPTGVLDPEISGPITFINMDVTCEGNRFPLICAPSTHEQFWERTEARAEYRDLKFDLRNKINPLRFLVDNILNSNYAIVVTDETKLDWELLRELTPPNATLLCAKALEA